MNKKPVGASASVVAIPASEVKARNASPSVTSTASLPAAANFLSVDPGPNLPSTLTTTSGPQAHYQHADMSSLPGGAPSVITNGLGETSEMQGITTIHIGDYPAQYPGNGDWLPNQPYLPPVVPTVVYPPLETGHTYTLNPQPAYWGVQKKTDVDKGGPEYWVVNPATLHSLLTLFVPTMVARCDTENDALTICRLLNEEHARNNAPKRSCSCGPNEACSSCPPGVVKEVPATLTYHHAKDELQTLQGRVLTILDATIGGEQQNKALKTIVKREFRASITGVFQFCHRHLNYETGPALDEPLEER